MTGFPGSSAAGLALLGSDKGSRELTGDVQQFLLKAHLEPLPRVKEAELLVKAGRPSAMIDISDGLAGELHHICESSGVGALLEMARFPVSKSVKQAAAVLGCNFWDWVLYGGEDYELLMTIPPGHVAAAKKALGTSLTVIGKVLDKAEGIKMLAEKHAVVELKRRGFDHFASG